MGVFSLRKSSSVDPSTPVQKKPSDGVGPFSLRGTSFPRLSVRSFRSSKRKSLFPVTASPMSVMSRDAKSPNSDRDSPHVVSNDNAAADERVYHSPKVQVLSPNMAALQARTFEAHAKQAEAVVEEKLTPQHSDLPDRPEAKPSLKGPTAVIARNTYRDSHALSEHWLIEYKDIVFGKTIGHSSFGTVHEGNLNGTKVAIKTIEQQPTSPKAHDILIAIKKEAELNCKLRHPNIVLYMGISIQPSKVCIVTELMARGNVRDLLVGFVKGRKIRLDWSLRQQWALDTATGMAYLHSLNPPMLHRDLKTTNLLVDRGMNVKICDFGLSRFKSDKLMSAVGTVHFAAPEVLRNERYTEKVDLFSYGTVMWELYTRECVFKGVPQIEIYQAVIDGNMPDVETGCDERYRSIMKACWELDVTKRPSFREVIDQLSILVEELENEGM